MDMAAFLSGWSSGETTLPYNGDRTYEEDISRMGMDTSVPIGQCAGRKERWHGRATGVVKPAYS